MKINAKFLKNLKKYFWAGIATIFPIFITFYILYLLFRFAENLLGRHVQSFLSSKFNFTIPGLGIIILFLIILIFGFFSRLLLWNWIYKKIDKLFKKIPVISSVYPAAKKLSDFLFSEKESTMKFRQVVLVEFPTSGSWSVAFITNEDISDLNVEMKNYVCVFLPLGGPTPFSGFVYWVPKDKIKKLNISIDKAITFIFSAGVVSK